MSDNSKIEWLAREGTKPATWNPITGCTKVSEGCKHCYAERMAKRLAGRFGYPENEPFAVTLHRDRLTEPLRWRKSRTIFVVSMGDLFHDAVNYETINDVFRVIAACAWERKEHTFIILTKRAERMYHYFQRHSFMLTDRSGQVIKGGWLGNPLPNVWLGITAENQQRADERIPLLLQCPAAVRFVSIEPMLEDVDLSRWLCSESHPASAKKWNPYNNVHQCHVCGAQCPDWIICGGESGPGARPMHPDWARSVRDQCQAAGVPFFFKQMSRRAPIPDDLQIREWPTVWMP